MTRRVVRERRARITIDCTHTCCNMITFYARTVSTHEYSRRHPRASSVVRSLRPRLAPRAPSYPPVPITSPLARDSTRRDATRSSHSRLRFDPRTPRWRPPPRAPSRPRAASPLASLARDVTPPVADRPGAFVRDGAPPRTRPRPPPRRRARNRERSKSS